MPRDQKHQNMKQKQHYNKFNKDFKNVLSCSVTFDSLHPLDCSPPGSSVHGILQARILEWIAISSPGDLPNPGIEPESPALQVESFTAEPQGTLMVHVKKKIHFLATFL